MGTTGNPPRMAWKAKNWGWRQPNSWPQPVGVLRPSAACQCCTWRRARPADQGSSEAGREEGWVVRGEEQTEGQG